MFKKNNEKKKLINCNESIIANDVEIEGTIKCSKVFVICGKVTGEINSTYGIKIEFGGEVIGNICAKEVIIKGKMVGDIECHSLLIAKGGCLKGTVKSKVFIVEPQGDFEGISHMTYEINDNAKVQIKQINSSS